MELARPAGQDFGPADMGGGGGPAKFWSGSEDSFWRRDLRALGPFGAEANFGLLNPVLFRRVIGLTLRGSGKPLLGLVGMDPLLGFPNIFYVA